MSLTKPFTTFQFFALIMLMSLTANTPSIAGIFSPLDGVYKNHVYSNRIGKTKERFSVTIPAFSGDQRFERYHVVHMHDYRMSQGDEHITAFSIGPSEKDYSQYVVSSLKSQDLKNVKTAKDLSKSLEHGVYEKMDRGHVTSPNVKTTVTQLAHRTMQIHNRLAVMKATKTQYHDQHHTTRYFIHYLLKYDETHMVHFLIIIHTGSFVPDGKHSNDKNIQNMLTDSQKPPFIDFVESYKMS